MLVSVYLCKNLNRKRAAAGSESAGDAVLPKEKCGASGKECGAKKRLLEKMPQGAGAFRRGCRGCRKTDALNREGRSLSCRRKKNAARQAKSVGKNGYLIICRKVSERFVAGVGLRESECAEPRRAVVVMPPKEKCGASGKECGAKKRLLEKMPQGAGAFRRGCRSCGKTNAPNREGRSLSCRRRKNAACQVKSGAKKNGCLRKFRKVPERLLQAPGLRENECAGPESAGGVSSDRKNRICRGRTLSRRDNTAPCL